MKKSKMVVIGLTEIEFNQVIISLVHYKEFFKHTHKMPLVESLLQRLTAAAPSFNINENEEEEC